MNDLIFSEILTRIRCLQCAEAVRQDDTVLRCTNGHAVAIQRGQLFDASQPDAYVDATTLRTAKSFGYEWTAFDEIQPEDREFSLMYFRDVPRESYAGLVALDVGCGKGRHSYFLAPDVRAVVAVDNSQAIEVAARNLRTLENVAIMKTDLRAMPFAPESFDFVFCLGVLHHLPDPAGALDSVLRHLKQDGRLLVYLYSKPAHRGVRSASLSTSRLLRLLSTRLPGVVVKAISRAIAVLLYGAMVIPGRIGERWGIEWLVRLPLGVYRRKPVRSLWLDTLDRLSAPLEKRYSVNEVIALVEGAGCELEALRDEAGYFALARKRTS
jgi:SAM-dependent methyltransferase